MPTPVRLALVALALATLPSAAAAAAEPAAHGHARVRALRAKVDAAGGRAARASSAAPAHGHEKADADAASSAKVSTSSGSAKSESLGSPNEGRLEGGVHLDVSKPYFRVVPAYESGDVRWGMPALVNLLDHAARSVQKRFPGAVLDVGDISRKGGGDVLRHHSHESGRDADVGFYAIDGKGKQVHAHGFVKFDTGFDASNASGAHFDLPRNWLLVQEMLTDPSARVSHIFVAAPLRQGLLAYARARGVSRAVLDRAAVVMMQPTTSLPHDDHFHVRISCPASMHKGCIELATVAGRGKARVATKTRGTRVILARPALAHPKSTEAHPTQVRPPAAAGTAPQDPFDIDVTGGAKDASDARDAAEARDAADANDAIDEGGAARIPD